MSIHPRRATPSIILPFDEEISKSMEDSSNPDEDVKFVFRFGDDANQENEKPGLKKLIKILQGIWSWDDAEKEQMESTIAKLNDKIKKENEHTIHDELMDLVLKAGADVNAKNSDGDTPLHRAASAQNIITVHTLVENKADVNITNICGETPLHIALRRKDFAIIYYLIHCGANVNTKNVVGMAPLRIAYENACFNLAMYLVKKGADVNVSVRETIPGVTDKGADTNTSREIIKLPTPNGFGYVSIREKCTQISNKRLVVPAPSTAHLIPTFRVSSTGQLISAVQQGSSTPTSRPSSSTELKPLLLVAYKDNRLEFVKTLLQSGACVDADYKGETILHLLSARSMSSS